MPTSRKNTESPVRPEAVRHVAELARLRLSDAESARMTDELNDILRHVDALAEVELEQAGDAGLEGAPAQPPGAPLRLDIAGADPLAFRPADFAPAWRDGFFTVPRLASHDAEGEDEGAGG